MMIGEPIAFIDKLQWYLAYCFAKTNQAILVGQSSRLSNRNSKQIVMGWVNRVNIVMWNNRMAIEFNKLNYQKRKKCGLGKIFYSQSALIQNNSNHIFIEEENTDTFLPHYAERFPVLDVSNNREVIKTVATKKFDNTSKIGYINKYNKCKQKQIAVRVLIEKSEIELLKTALQRLANLMIYYTPDFLVDELDNAVFRVVKSLTGERINRNENIGAFISKKYLLPFKTELLNQTLHELKNEIMSNGAKRKQLAKYLQKRLLNLKKLCKKK
ncbi:MAG: hypothetical protein OMM_05396 [Candidatus Magnetoglobus multicellularis str. Araruama]|uniref:Uncharacterized protein n=1 Tax=Candidatus Magnetoglobus multicellularis str. Araruama TaxID=890399 RepID=A0A1V1NWM6_9BACT|nr:MAG: hypothetical protein OMM_05396 [Candidatus Magnetoglobus multicellularis str. Araruama]